MDKKTKQILNETAEADFDGHTEFAKMTPDQRLSWLDSANAAFIDLHALARPELRVAEDSPDYKTDSE